MARNNQVNASLIHELRMIIQTLAVSRSFHGRVKKKAATHSESLLCVRCIRDKDHLEEPAVVMMNGHSLCRKHAISGIDRG